VAKLSELRNLMAKAHADAPPTPSTAARARKGRHAPAALQPDAALPSTADSPTPRGGVSPRRQLAATKHADADIDLTLAFADVEPLPASRKIAHARPRPAPVPQQRIADAEAALAASKYGAEPAPQHWEIGQEHEAEQTFLRRGMPSDVLQKLRRGHWSVQDEFDLHRMTTTEARDALVDFLAAARQRGARCVRVIHGKGLTSPGKEPVLKGKVRKWLAHWDDVLAYCEAPPHAGGGGAVLVLLRGSG
jgi:DNA-nicking Smr family endonuclease